MENYVDKKVCKSCQQIKTRIRSGKYPNSKNARFVDEMGGHWMGHTCPDCNRKKQKALLQERRIASKIKQLTSLKNDD